MSKSKMYVYLNVRCMSKSKMYVSESTIDTNDDGYNVR